MLKEVIYGVTAIVASFRALCPRVAESRDHEPPCPDPLGKAVFSAIVGGAAAVAYYFGFIRNRTIECCDIVAVSIVAYLFSNFIWTLFFTKKMR